MICKQWLELAATVLANETHAASRDHGASAGGSAHQAHSADRDPRAGRRLAVLVMEGGQIHQHILTLEEPTSQEQLVDPVRYKFSQIFAGKNLQGIEPVPRRPMSQLEKTRCWPGWKTKCYCAPTRLPTGEIYMDGMTNLLAAPEFSDSEEARKSAAPAGRTFDYCKTCYHRLYMPDTIGGVQVLIGGEGNWNDLRQCSVDPVQIWFARNCHGHIGRFRTDAHGIRTLHFDGEIPLRYS